jgi:hypothetical protein
MTLKKATVVFPLASTDAQYYRATRRDDLLFIHASSRKRSKSDFIVSSIARLRLRTPLERIRVYVIADARATPNFSEAAAFARAEARDAGPPRSVRGAIT